MLIFNTSNIFFYNVCVRYINYSEKDRLVNMKRSIVTVIVTGLIIAAMWTFSPKTINNSSVDVLTVKPQTKNIYDYINASGKVKEGNKHNIYSDGIAKVAEVYVQVGDTVNAGDVLAEITPISGDDIDWGSYYSGARSVASVFEEYGVEIDFGISDVSKTVNTSDGTKKIKSPISGTITDVNIQKGDNISSINKLISVSDFSDLYIKAMIPEEYSSKVKKGQRVEISAEAFGNCSYSGSLESVSPVAKYVPSIMGDGKTYIEAVINIEKPTQLLKPELNVNAKIASETKINAITLPYECILQDADNREYVYCVENGIAQKRFINVGYELENEVEIKGGIKDNDSVIINPPDELRENMSVSVK